MDEIDRLKTFEPPEKEDENKIQVKLFLDEEIRFLELDPDVSYEELVISVGKVFIESYLIKFEDSEKHHITIKTSDDLRIAVKNFERGEIPYIKLFLERAGENKRGFFGFRKKKGPGGTEDSGGGFFGRRKTDDDE